MKCQYPGCKLVAKDSWALVPVCFEHGDAIRKETFQYYEGRLEYIQRVHYHKISNRIKFRYQKKVRRQKE